MVVADQRSTSLTKAFRNNILPPFLKLAADIGHYIGDAHVPLHASCSNYDGQFTNQRGIHALWESVLPELPPKNNGSSSPCAPSIFPILLLSLGERCWKVLQHAADTVLQAERRITDSFPPESRYSFAERNGKLQRQYAVAFASAYHMAMNEMTERRLKQSIQAVAASWYTAWVNAGQPDSAAIDEGFIEPERKKDLQLLQTIWIKRRKRSLINLSNPLPA